MVWTLLCNGIVLFLMCVVGVVVVVLEIIRKYHIINENYDELLMLRGSSFGLWCEIVTVGVLHTRN